jgi:hypothetical protein
MICFFHFFHFNRARQLSIQMEDIPDVIISISYGDGEFLDLGVKVASTLAFFHHFRDAGLSVACMKGKRNAI